MKHSPEPWHAEDSYLSAQPGVITGQEIYAKDGTLIGLIESHVNDSRRVLECVNALAGVEDPGKAVKALVEALRYSFTCIEMRGYERTRDWKVLGKMIEKALAPFKEKTGA